MHHRGELIERRAADFLRRGIRRDKLRELRLQLLQFPVPHIVFVVIDFRCILHVIFLVMILQFCPQRVNAPGGLLHVHSFPSCYVFPLAAPIALLKVSCKLASVPKLANICGTSPTITVSATATSVVTSVVEDTPVR